MALNFNKTHEEEMEKQNDIFTGDTPRKREERRHRETINILKQSGDLTKWFLIATVLIALTSVMQIMKEWGAKQVVLTVIYLAIIIIGIAVLIRVLMLIFKEEKKEEEK